MFKSKEKFFEAAKNFIDSRNVATLNNALDVFEYLVYCESIVGFVERTCSHLYSFKEAEKYRAVIIRVANNPDGLSEYFNDSDRQEFLKILSDEKYKYTRYLVGGVKGEFDIFVNAVCHAEFVRQGEKGYQLFDDDVRYFSMTELSYFSGSTLFLEYLIRYRSHYCLTNKDPASYL